MLEEKIDTLTKEIVALRQAIEANGTGGGATEAAPAKKTAAKKPAKVEPEHDADEVGAAVRKAAKRNKPVMQAWIKKQKCADLAEVLTKPELFDAAFDFAESVEEPEAADEDDDV